MDIAPAILLSALAMTLIVGLRYLATSGLFAAITARVRPGLYGNLQPQIRRAIRWSLASAAIYGVPAGVVAWGWQQRGWTAIYQNWSDYPLWYAPLSLLLYLAAHDTWFYWTHRWMHRPTPFRVAHAVHHASRPPTAWAAMAFHPYEALTGAVVIPALVFLIPIHVAMLGLVLAIMTLMGITNHMGWEMFPRWLVHGPAGKHLITASHHQRHHGSIAAIMACISASGIGSAARTAGLALSTLALLAAPLRATEPVGTTLDLAFDSTRNTRGLIRICLTSNPRHFPDCSGDAAARTLSVSAAQGSARFTGLAAGTYAVSVIHDENGNGRMDMALMVPREGFGFSRNPRIGMGPPRFQAAAFAVGETPVRQDVRIRYML